MGRCLAGGKAPFVEDDDPVGDLVGCCCRQDRVPVVHLLFSPGDVGEQQHSAHRRRRIDIGVEQLLPGCRAQRDGLLEALDPKLPEDITVAGVDGEQRAVADA